MSYNYKIFNFGSSGGGSVNNGVLQISGGGPLSASLQSVTDQLGNVFPFTVATNEIQFNQIVGIGRAAAVGYGLATTSILCNHIHLGGSISLHINGYDSNKIGVFVPTGGLFEVNINGSVASPNPYFRVTENNSWIHSNLTFGNVENGPIMGSTLGGAYTPAGSYLAFSSGHNPDWVYPSYDFKVANRIFNTTPADASRVASIINIPNHTFAVQNAAATSVNYRGISLAYTINNTVASIGMASGIFLNATETALNGMTHNLMNLQTNGVNKFTVSSTGNTTLLNNSNTTALFTISNPDAGTSARTAFLLINGPGDGDSVAHALFGKNWTDASVRDAYIINSNSGVVGGMRFQSDAGGIRFSTSSYGANNLRVEATTGLVNINTSVGTAQLQVHTRNATTPALILRGFASQSSNMIGIEDSTGFTNFSIGSTGNISHTSGSPIWVFTRVSTDLNPARMEFLKASGVVGTPSIASAGAQTGAYFFSAYGTSSYIRTGMIVNQIESNSGTVIKSRHLFNLGSGGGTSVYPRVIIAEEGMLLMDVPDMTAGPSWTTPVSAKLEVRSNSTTRPSIIARNILNQTADQQQWQSDTGTVLTRIFAGGGIGIVSMADASAPNSSLYFSTTASKLVWKDAGGVVNNLY